VYINFVCVKYWLDKFIIPTLPFTCDANEVCASLSITFKILSTNNSTLFNLAFLDAKAKGIALSSKPLIVVKLVVTFASVDASKSE